MACQCSCPFCFSRSSISALESAPARWSDEELRTHFNWSASRGASRMVVTGGGEPLLRPDECGRAIRLAADVFDEIALFTNGARLSSPVAAELRAAGLSYLCWSRHAVDDAENRAIMGDAAPTAEAVLAAAHGAGLPVRATCVMSTAGVVDPGQVWAYIGAFTALGITEFTFKHTYVASARSLFSSSDANLWCREHQIHADPFAGRGHVVGKLPWAPKSVALGRCRYAITTNRHRSGSCGIGWPARPTCWRTAGCTRRWKTGPACCTGWTAHRCGLRTVSRRRPARGCYPAGSGRVAAPATTRRFSHRGRGIPERRCAAERRRPVQPLPRRPRLAAPCLRTRPD
ncbi:radical SAM superfamily protein [Mycobacterium kansasii]|uniref:Radical SAM superfamily protein n=1 Tax=Mycobacterium kansasii TaxID=1768 RepID=A0A1V3XWX4_MYCKA|nr:radical SAM superfamily protein [Mycobacterium kansasii]